MNFKKTIAKSLVVAMALGMVPMANLESAKAEAATITFDGATGIATAETAKFWGIAKEDKKGGKGSVHIGDKNYKVTNIQDVVNKEIDVYSVLKGKAGIIVAGVKEKPDSDWGVLDLKAAENTFKVYMVASKSAIKGIKGEKAVGGVYGYITASTGKQPTEYSLKENSEKVEVKLNDSSWVTFKSLFGDTDESVNGRLHLLGQSGASLSFRIKATNKAWASKEVKVKALVPAKGPRVKVDISNHKTSIKTGMEYQVVKTGSAAGDAWKVSTEKKGLSLVDLKLGDEDKDILVRTSANGKKLASKITKITLHKPAAALNVPAFNTTGGAVAKVCYVETNLAYDITKGASLYNTSANDIEWALVGTNGKVKWSTLKASKDPAKKPSKAALKYSAVAKDNTWGSNGVKLFLRSAGVKQTKDGVATQSGVSAGGVMALKNIEQKFTFDSATADSNATVEVAAGSTTAAIKVATGTAAKITIKAKIAKVVNPKGGSAKVKATTALPKGVTLKAGKIDYATGKFDIVVDVSKTAFKDAVTKSTAEYSLQFEGIKDAFKISIDKKN